MLSVENNENKMLTESTCSDLEEVHIYRVYIYICVYLRSAT